MNMIKNKSAKWDAIWELPSYGMPLFYLPLFRGVMEHPKSLHWTSGSANSSRARYLDKAGPKEEANFCDLFIKFYFLSEPCVSWLLCFACNSRSCFGNHEEQQHKNAGTFFLALETRSVTLQFERRVKMINNVGFR